jgi:hypothetical protein
VGIPVFQSGINLGHGFDTEDFLRPETVQHVADMFLRVVDSVVPSDGTGAANVKHVRHVLNGLRAKEVVSTLRTSFARRPFSTWRTCLTLAAPVPSEGTTESNVDPF